MISIALALLRPQLRRAAPAAGGFLGHMGHSGAADLAGGGKAAADAGQRGKAEVCSRHGTHACMVNTSQAGTKAPRKRQEANRKANQRAAPEWRRAAAGGGSAAGSLQTHLDRSCAAVATIWRRLDSARRLIRLLVGWDRGAAGPCGGCGSWAPLLRAVAAPSPAGMLEAPSQPAAGAEHRASAHRRPWLGCHCAELGAPVSTVRSRQLDLSCAAA